MNEAPNPTPAPENPVPNTPIEIDTGGLHARPEVDYGSEPSIPEPHQPEREEPNRNPETPEPEQPGPQ